MSEPLNVNVRWFLPSCHHVQSWGTVNHGQHIIIARAGNTTVWPFYPISSDSSSSVTRECEQHKAAKARRGWLKVTPTTCNLNKTFMPLLLPTDLQQMWLGYSCYLVTRGAHNNFNIQGNIIGFKTLLYNARQTARKCRCAVHHFNVMEATDKTNIAPPWAGGRRHPRVK